jgi:hypothetical protein
MWCAKEFTQISLQVRIVDCCAPVYVTKTLQQVVCFKKNIFFEKTHFLHWVSVWSSKLSLRTTGIKKVMRPAKKNAARLLRLLPAVSLALFLSRGQRVCRSGICYDVTPVLQTVNVSKSDSIETK